MTFPPARDSIEGVEAISTSPGRLRPVAFEALYRRELEGIVRIAFLITRSRPVAEEIAQEAFVTVLERWISLANPGAYLRTTVVRAAVRSRARTGREHELLRAERRRDVPEPGVDEMWEMLGELPSMQRAAIVLRFYCDLPHDQIAGVLHCTPASARMLTH